MTRKILGRRLWFIVLLGLGACGGSAPGAPGTPGTPSAPGTPAACGSCRGYEICKASGRCGIDRERTWLFGVTDATIATKKPSGEAWDAFGGAPAPFVTINGARTTTVQDSFSPVWNLGESFLAGTLLDEGVVVQVWDEDISNNDAITMPTRLGLEEADFTLGRRTLSGWFGAERITFVLEPR